MTSLQKHSKQFYGRPKSQVTTLLGQTERGISKTQKRRDAHYDLYMVAMSKLSADERRAITRYVEDTLSVEGLTTFRLALEWFLGQGLDQRAFSKNFTVLWGEEISYPHEGGR